MNLPANSATYSMKQFVIGPYNVAFIISFALVSYYTFSLPDLLSGGGDANSIWQTITSFHNDPITSSYVLYKGFLSVYPYVWLYDLSIFFDLDPFVFIKLYHCLLFAYVSAVGVPFVISELLAVKLRPYRNVIFVIVIFFMFKFTNIFSMLMVDLPSWAFFVAGISAVIKLSKRDAETPKYKYFYSGLLVGLSLCASGQFKIAALLLILYVVVSLLSKGNLKSVITNRTTIVVFMLFIFGALIPKIYDAHFERTIVDPMRDRGEWLPTGEVWLLSGMTRLLPHYKYGYPNASNRGLAILKETEGDGFEQRYENIKLGGGAYTAAEYVHIVKDNFFDFIVMWGTKTFISISFDGGNARVSHLAVSYSSLFLCAYLLYSRCRNIRDLLSSKAIIYLAILSTIAAPVFLFVDMRYGVTLQSFIIGLALFDDFIWVRLKNYLSAIAGAAKSRKLRFGVNNAIPYPLLMFLIYLLFCFLLYGALLEIPGSNPNDVLFNL